MAILLGFIVTIGVLIAEQRGWALGWAKAVSSYEELMTAKDRELVALRETVKIYQLRDAR